MMNDAGELEFVIEIIYDLTIQRWLEVGRQRGANSKE